MEKTIQQKASHEFVKSLLAQYGAFKAGHGVLSSGLHTDMFIDAEFLFQHTYPTEQIASLLAKNFLADEIDVVVGVPDGGDIFAYEISRQLNMFTKKDVRHFRGTKLLQLKHREDEMFCRGKNILLVDDIATTGYSLWEWFLALVKLKPNMIHIGMLAKRGVLSALERSAVDLDFQGKRVYLADFSDLNHWSEDACPDCNRSKYGVYS